MRVYHGGGLAVVEPKILTEGYEKDFGYGFYCTKLKRQAVRWAKRKSSPVVSIYDYTPYASLSIKTFNSMSEDWLDFIVHCRSGKSHDFDVVVGPMADDQLYNYIVDYIDGTLTREQFWVLAKFKYPTHQICFSTQKALSALTFIGSENISL